MSSFRQLMMKEKGGSSKIEIFATKVGSPTIVDGVVSGFSSSKYLYFSLANTNLQNGFHCKLRFTTGNSVTTEQAIFQQSFYSGVGTQFGLTTHPNSSINNFVFYYCKNSPSYYSGYVYPNFRLSANTTYDFECEFSNGTITWRIGTPDNLIEQTPITDANYDYFDYTRSIWIGYTNSGAFQGSIDLNYCLFETEEYIWKGGYN